MRYIYCILIMLISFTSYSQAPTQKIFSGRLNIITSATLGVNTFTVTGDFVDLTNYTTVNDIGIGDVIYDKNCNRYTITTITRTPPRMITVQVLGNNSTVPFKGPSALVDEALTTYPPQVSGVDANINACIDAHFKRSLRTEIDNLVLSGGGGGSVDLTGIRDSLEYLYSQTAQPDTAQVVVYKPAHGQNPALCPGGILPLTENFDAATAANVNELPFTYAIGTRGPDSLVIKASGFLTRTGHGLTVGQVYYQQDDPCDLGLTPGTIDAPVLLVIDANTIQLIDRSGTPGEDAVRIWIPSSQFTSRGDDPSAPLDSTAGAIGATYQLAGLIRPGGIMVYQLPAGTNNPTYTAASNLSSTPARAWYWDGVRATRITNAGIAVDMQADSVGNRVLIPATSGSAEQAALFVDNNYQTLPMPNGTYLYWKGSGTDVNPDTAYVVVDNPTVTGGQRVMLVKSLSPGSGVADGDYGDIDVTGSGTVWTIDTSAVTWPKLAQAVKDSIQVGGSGLPFVFQYDNFRLPATHEFLFAQGLAANESVTNYGFASVDNTKYKFSTTGLGASTTEYGGWLANGTSGDSIAISAPCGVVIGDSQAEGHPARHGRLHPNGASTFSVNYQDTLGTISYTLRQLTKMRWFNHGIGGQTSDQVWARWPRDVLAQTFNPSDGRGSKTLQRKPNTVVIIVGINDFFVHTRSWTVTAQNLENMAQSARDNGIQAVFLNCPGDESANMVQIRKVDSLNTWMASGALQAFGAAVVDYNSWWRDPAYNDNGHGQSLIVDVIHPSAIGYDSLANVIFRAAKLPVLNKIRFTNELSPLGFSGYSRPAGITIQGVAHTLASAQDVVLFSTPLAWDSVWVKINSSTNVTGTTYSGFSHIEWLYSNDTSNVLTKRNELYQAYQGRASTLFSRSGTLISPTTTGDRLSIGTTTASASTTMFTVRGTTTDATVHTRMESSAAANPIVFTNNGRIGINRTGASYNLHVSGTAGFEASGSDYWFFNGSASEVFGANPRFRFQSTSRNTGSTGRTDMDMIWTGNVFSVAPVSTAVVPSFMLITSVPLAPTNRKKPLATSVAAVLLAMFPLPPYMPPAPAAGALVRVLPVRVKPVPMVILVSSPPAP